MRCASVAGKRLYYREGFGKFIPGSEEDEKLPCPVHALEKARIPTHTNGMSEIRCVRAGGKDYYYRAGELIVDKATLEEVEGKVKCTGQSYIQPGPAAKRGSERYSCEQRGKAKIYKKNGGTVETWEVPYNIDLPSQ